VQVRKLRSLAVFLCGCLSVLATISLPAAAQATAPNEWTWMGGSSSSGGYGAMSPPGVYGTLGTPATTNNPGFRWGSSDWTDSSGNFWLFGGHGVDANGNYGYLNDLWKFNPSTGEWTWMSGSSTFGQSIQYCEGDDCGRAGVYGTLGTPAPGNVPGGRTKAASWTDSNGNFWLFGGDGFDGTGDYEFGACQLNDMWMYNPATNEWVWTGGSSTSGGCGVGGPIAGVYGTLGTPAAGNFPGQRWNASSSTDSHGNFWLFGGAGSDSVGKLGLLNDIWEFNPSSNEWAWMGGSNTVGTLFSDGWDTGQPGVYGTLGTPAAGNVPGGREGAISWIDSSDDLWFFGGFGGTVPTLFYFGYLNDLWKFDPSSKEWAWMGGSSNVDPHCPPLDANGGQINNCQFWLGQPGVYGELGTPSAGNVPSSRWLAATWTDSNGNLWLFGGQGVDANYYPGYLNDFWELNISTNPVQWTWMGGSSTLPTSCAGMENIANGTDLGLLNCGPSGVYGTLGTPDNSNIPGGRDTASSWTDKSGDFWLFGGYGFDASGNWSHLNDLWVFQSTVGTLPASMPTFSPVTGIYAAGQTVQISDAAPNATIYYTTDGITPTTNSPVYSGPITISSTETIKAIATANDYAASAPASAVYTIAPPTQTPTFSVPSGTYATVQSVTISDAAAGAIINYTVDGTVPTASSTVYSGPIVVSSSETIEAIATAAGYATSPVAVATYTIPPNFTIALNPTSISVQAGKSGTTTITVQDEAGFNSNISFACSGLPSGATCSFSTLTVPTPAGTSYSALTVTTSADTAALHRTPSLRFPGSVLAVAICCFGWKKRRRPPMLLLFALCFASLSLVTACSGGSSGGGGGPQPVTSTITVNATSGTLQHSTTFSLTVD